MTRWNDERGSITAFVAVVATALVMVAGMAYDIAGWPDDWLWQSLIFEQGGKLTDPAIGAIEDKTAFLALALIDLADAAPIARAGELKLASAPGADVDPNISTFAIACVALLFAEEGKPSEELDEDQFFAIVGALIGPRLDAMAEMISRNDAAGLARELAEIKGMY